MNYDGIEIDVLNLGDADSILVTHWFNANANPIRVLIDGGNSSDSERVLDFLRTRGITYIDHLVCSHPHDDHAAGLIAIVNSGQINFGTAWLHSPALHSNFVNLRQTLSKTCAARVRKILQESLETQFNLRSAILKRNVLLMEPFSGATIGFLTVCSPSKAFYEQQLAQFADLAKLDELEEALALYQNRLDCEDYQQQGGFFATYLRTEDIGLGQAPTEPENETSTVLGCVYNTSKCLLTADAGVQALSQAKIAYNLADLDWMQIPHHGSRRNVNEELIEYFKPKLAYVSAAGNNKHPRRKVVNAFKNVGTRVFSTHYQQLTPGHLWYKLGNVPPRADYSNAIALYDAG
jgi:beta-lactamase superfamily II metal-dependent hydrolase